MNIGKEESNLIKKFSFGIVTSISLEEYIKIIKKYNKYIKSVYFSLPCGDEFHTRKRVKEEYQDINVKKKLYDILKLMKYYNIEIEAVINQYHISEEKLSYALDFLENYIDVDAICCLDEYLPAIKKKFPNKYIISSFNNLKLTEQDIIDTAKDYNQIVVGKEFLRNINLFNSINNYEFDNKLLLNNGCCFNCNSCRAGSELCRKIFEKNLKKHSILELYAFQSFFPSELHKLIDLGINIDELKLSNRPCTFEYLNNCLESYILGEEKSYIDNEKSNFYLWGRLGHFSKYYDYFEFEKIKNIKQKIWENKIIY